MPRRAKKPALVVDRAGIISAAQLELPFDQEPDLWSSVATLEARTARYLLERKKRVKPKMHQATLLGGSGSEDD